MTGRRQKWRKRKWGGESRWEWREGRAATLTWSDIKEWRACVCACMFVCIYICVYVNGGLSAHVCVCACVLVRRQAALCFLQSCHAMFLETPPFFHYHTSWVCVESSWPTIQLTHTHTDTHYMNGLFSIALRLKWLWYILHTLNLQSGVRHVWAL